MPHAMNHGLVIVIGLVITAKSSVAVMEFARMRFVGAIWGGLASSVGKRARLRDSSLLIIRPVGSSPLVLPRSTRAMSSIRLLLVHPVQLVQLGVDGVSGWSGRHAQRRVVLGCRDATGLSRQWLAQISKTAIANFVAIHQTRGHAN